jgi:molybdopterin-guanine dinucleotide biosynthesis protein A
VVGAGFDRLAFTVVDDGWPTTRTVADLEVDGERARLVVLLAVTDGQPACLLCHWHTPSLDRLRQRLFRGRCWPSGDRMAFEPASTFTVRNETRLDRLRFIVAGKRRTRAYFRSRSE